MENRFISPASTLLTFGVKAFALKISFHLDSARNIKRTAATAAALLLEQPASDPQSHLAARSASSCDWVNFRALPLSLRSPEGAEKPRAP
jgi:hypothetical protein